MSTRVSNTGALWPASLRAPASFGHCMSVGALAFVLRSADPAIERRGVATEALAPSTSLPLGCYCHYCPLGRALQNHALPQSNQEVRKLRDA
jgi:hypothetical protein